MTVFIPQNALPDVMLVKPKRFEDSRGFFEESYVFERFADNGIKCRFVQDNHAFSVQKGVLRGLHYQMPPHAQDKLVRCSRGSIIDVAVDIRIGSPTYGKHVKVELSAENGYQLFVPRGFAHGYCTMEENCEVQYKVSDYYAPEYDAGIAFDDVTLGIEWPFESELLIVSDKDRQNTDFKSLESPFKYGVSY